MPFVILYSALIALWGDSIRFFSASPAPFVILLSYLCIKVEDPGLTLFAFLAGAASDLIFDHAWAMDACFFVVASLLYRFFRRVMQFNKRTISLLLTPLLVFLLSGWESLFSYTASWSVVAAEATVSALVAPALHSLFGILLIPWASSYDAVVSRGG